MRRLSVLRISGIAKHYGSVTALQDVDFASPGEGDGAARRERRRQEHAGEDTRRPRARRRGRRGNRRSARAPAFAEPCAACGRGLCDPGTQYRRPSSVAENICLGGATGSDLDQGPAGRSRSSRSSTSSASECDRPVRPGGQPAVAQQQLVEIARLLSRNARISFFDEPTAALSDAEIEKVKSVVQLAGRRPFDHLRHPPPGRGVRDRRSGHDFSQRPQLRARRSKTSGHR